MQDLVDVVSTSKLNLNCTCSNSNSITNEQDLQNAENLRLQISRLKEIQSISSSNRPRLDTRERSSSSSNSSGSAFTPNGRLLRFDSNDSTVKNYSIENRSFNNRKLPALESMQSSEQHEQMSERKSSSSSISSNNTASFYNYHHQTNNNSPSSSNNNIDINNKSSKYACFVGLDFPFLLFTLIHFYRRKKPLLVYDELWQRISHVKPCSRQW
ncbi:uncharacterized protein RHIMIDRAFT_282084 [Rhizopus microsporus ATCC 52813]|uniref:Uncharacterized protein n=1 Tax=Rhizopus microsporus ATCC 52813 TaxID=1340429 RepID=A0A2G4SUM3_RHIZD|nr:uncharacterized protein RHIMIDRAFT_282084 [Rhizopus microsporus ATCC 52813]PHZ12452.1 hypothetical protein RHIMIDRAFT_282084 [Rhizopus microsporus ATCC 52813]